MKLQGLQAIIQITEIHQLKVSNIAISRFYDWGVWFEIYDFFIRGLSGDE